MVKDKWWSGGAVKAQWWCSGGAVMLKDKMVELIHQNTLRDYNASHTLYMVQ